MNSKCKTNKFICCFFKCETLKQKFLTFQRSQTVLNSQNFRIFKGSKKKSSNFKNLNLATNFINKRYNQIDFYTKNEQKVVKPKLLKKGEFFYRSKATKLTLLLYCCSNKIWQTGDIIKDFFQNQKNVFLTILRTNSTKISNKTSAPNTN